MRIELPYPPSVNMINIASGDIPTESCIYILECVPSCKFYIGSAMNLKRRIAYHMYRAGKGTHPNPAFQSAWAKHGMEGFRVGVLEAVPDVDMLILREQSWLDEARAATRRDFYNVLPVAGSHLGAKRSDETKRKMSASQKGRKFSACTKMKMRAAKVGRPLSESHRRKIGDASRGRKINRPHGIINHSSRRFDDNQVKEIRMRKKNGETYSELSKRFSICVGPLYRIVHGITYKDVD